MERWQNMVFAMVMVQLLAVLVLFHVLAGNYTALGIVKYAVVGSIFTASLFLRAGTADHRLLKAAILFLFAGDFFLILSGTFPGVSPNDRWVKVGGMIGFALAYLSLIIAYNRSFSPGGRDILAMVPVLAVVAPVIYVLAPLLSGAMLAWSLVFTFILSFMAWSAICTLNRGYYTRKAALRFAWAGYLMFLSDMGVAFGFFYPGLDRNMPWLGTEIWITYIPAWSLILMNLSDPTLRNFELELEEPAVRGAEA